MTLSRFRLLALVLPGAFGVPSATAAGPGLASASGAPLAHYFVLIAPSGTPRFALQGESPQPAAPDPLPEGKGKDVTKRVCTGCHSVTTFAKQRHTPEEWATIVDAMVSRGLDATDDELTTVKNYLSADLPAPKQDAPAATTSQPPSKQ